MEAVDSGHRSFRETRIDHWDRVARSSENWERWGKYYHNRLEQIYTFLVAPGQRVLELGCGQGDLLAACKPSYGVGVDFSSEMIRRAGIRHPQITFVQSDVCDFTTDQRFDVIIVSDLLNDLWDVQAVFERISKIATSRTRIILNFYSKLWELPLAAARKMGLARPNLYQNWLTKEDIFNFLNLTDLEAVRHWCEILWPFDTPVVSTICNNYVVRIWPFSSFALTHFVVARLRANPQNYEEEQKVSVIVPARNEAGNVPIIFNRIPQMGRETELIFVEGHSTDGTYDAIRDNIERHPQLNCQVFRQTGKGKGDAVRLGFEKATGDILMILDADMTVPPEALPRFYEAIRSGKGEFVNGVRLVYPMEKKAMRFVNLVGNKFFSLAFSWLLGQSTKDTLCGTKVISRENYKAIAANRSYFGDFDPFGDFDLLFGAAKLNLKIVEIPIRYRERTYGDTNIQRWRHGMLLVRMVAFASRRIKFI
ncbi:MAG: glycosyltransferase [Desulfoferrobacter sp.]